IYNKGFTNIVGSGVTLIGTFAVMLRLDWQLTLLSLAIVPLLIGTIYFFAKRIRTQSTTIQEQESALLTQTQEGLSSIRMVHAFGREEFEVSQFHEQAHGSLQANLRLTMTTVKSALIINTLIVIGTAAMYYVGSLHVLAGTLSLGVLLVFIAYLVMLYQPLESLTYTAWAMEGATAGARRCFEILDSRDDVVDSPNAIAIEETSGAISFQSVSFGYESDREILSYVNLEIAPNQIIALVGGTGAGKSTLLSLVPRFYDPTAGRLTLDGRDIREITKKSLRQHIAIVLQDTLLFSTTVRENIAYGRPDATDVEIREAARRAQADEFISQLPNGYESEVGERGGHLSVGQRQRIGIARAFMQNSTLPGNSTHEQRRRGPQSGKRLVGASDPAECRFWRGVLLRDRAGVSLHENERAARTPFGRSCFGLRRLFLCPGCKWFGRCWRFYLAQRRACHGGRTN